MSAIKQVVALERRQKQELQSMLRKGRWSARSLRRAKILLIANDEPSLSNSRIAQQVACHRETARNVKNRFIKEGLEPALFDKPRSGAPPKINDQDKAYLIAKACTPSPQGYDHWTLRLLTNQLAHHRGKKVSGETVRRVLLQNKLKPWLKKNVVYS